MDTAPPAPLRTAGLAGYRQHSASSTTPMEHTVEITMKVEGSCHCGNVTYEAEVDPNSAHVCNCTDCQILTGSGFRVTVHAPGNAFRLLSGQPKVYVKVADSGAKRRHSFCPDCGTPVHSTADTESPTSYSLRVGCLRQRALLAPKTVSYTHLTLPTTERV